MRDCKTLEELKAYASRFFTDLEPVKGRDLYTCKIRVYNYIDMMHIAENLIKLCVVATHPDGQEVSDLVISSRIDVNRMLELALQFMPSSIDEFADEMLNLVKDDNTQQQT